MARPEGEPVELGVLGPLEVRCDGVSVVVGGSRERALLTRLLLSANQVVSLETLAEDLWAGEPPEGAAQALWVYMSRLRKALRDHGGDGALVTRSPRLPARRRARRHRRRPVRGAGGPRPETRRR